MKKTIFEKALKESLLIGFRTKSLEWGESIIGFITVVEEDCFSINEIDSYGFHIGTTTILLDDVINIDLNDRYMRRLKFIHEKRALFDRKKRITIWKEGHDLIPYFDRLMKNGSITTFYFNEEDYLTGIILEHDNHYFKIKNIGKEGDDDGQSCYPIGNLIGLRYNSIEEQRIELLYENKDKFE